jgi:hypothetical protein
MGKGAFPVRLSAVVRVFKSGGIEGRPTTRGGLDVRKFAAATQRNPLIDQINH